MKAIQFAQNLSVALASIGLLVPNAGSVLGSEIRPAALTRTDSQANKVVDVSLVDGGTLRGQVVSGNGVAQAGTAVVVQHGREVVATAKTNHNGEFSVQGLKGGLYVVSTDGAAGVVRAWAPRTAPPSAVNAVLLVPSDQAVRAQSGAFISQYGGAALVVGGILATAILVAIEHNDDDAS